MTTEWHEQSVLADNNSSRVGCARADYALVGNNSPCNCVDVPEGIVIYADQVTIISPQEIRHG